MSDDNGADHRAQTRRERILAPFTPGTYVVIDIGGPVAAQVMEVRRRHGYDHLGALPVEITVIGSGGVGSPRADQDPGQFFAALDRMASSTPPFAARFSGPLRFPGTDIFAMAVEDEGPFGRLHERIVGEGFAFENVPHPFTPHCTLRQGPPPSEDEVADLLTTRINGEFVCDSISVYVADRFPLRLRYRAYLRSSGDS